MSEVAVEFDHVWKKFRRGEIHDSLRDLIPSLGRALFAKNKQKELQQQEFWAIQDVSFQIPRGKAMGVIGPNGAGKSTILKLLSGILRPNSGKATVRGRISAVIEVGAGFHPDLTGRENIYLNATILGMKRGEIDRKFDEIVAFSGIGDFIDTPVKRYSSGMYARLGFSVAAHVDPEVLLVDEVLSVGDMRFQERCLQKMHSIVESGTTVIFISHNLAAINTLCPNSIFLAHGQIQRMGPSEEVIQVYIGSVQDDDQVVAKDAPIWGIKLVDEKGEALNRLHPGGQGFLRFKLRSDLSLKDYLLGLIIQRASDGLTVCDYNLPLDSVSASPKPADGLQCTLRFDANLLRGAYTAQLHLYHFPSAKHLIRIRNAAFFSVEETISWDGVAHLSPVLTFGDNGQ